MKLRTTSNSIRLRLSQTDVKVFSDASVVEENVQVGPGSDAIISYRLTRSDTIDSATAVYKDHCLTVSVPSAVADRWATSEEVGIEASQPNGVGGELSIVIEKDFACIKPRSGDDDEDTFPNPAATCA